MRPALPWRTLVLAATVLAAAALPGAVEALQLERGGGEPWRLLTAHLVHGSTYHLAWNVTALIALGLLFEELLRRRLWSLMLTSGLTVGVGLLLLAPDLGAYRGLSGMLNGVWAGGALLAARVERARGNRAMAGIYLLCVLGDLLKIVVEAAGGAPIFSDAARLGGRPVPLAHALGALGGMIWLAGCRLGTVSPVQSRQSDRDRHLGQVVLEDLRGSGLPRNYRQELKDLYKFYLDEETRTRLEDMGRFRRAFALLGWLLKSMLLKLSPGRRLALLLAMVLGVLGWTSIGVGGQLAFDFRPWGFVILLIVLMLELKDKLLAKDEILIARKVQLALLPENNPRIPGWSVWGASRPANTVGGDLVDYVEVDGFRHGIVLGDVAGKGLGAALLSAKLQATLRALIPQASSLDELADRVNTIFHRDGLDNRFATLFYAELEHDSGQVRYVNAGHNPAFLLRSNGTERLEASSYPLGILPEASYEEATTFIDVGDVIVTYSDGLTEAANPAGDEFGIERLEQLLVPLVGQDPETIGNAILEDVDRFLAGVRAADDLSLVVIVRR